MTYNSLCSMFDSPRSLFAMHRSLFGLYTLEPTILAIPCSSSGMKEPYVYMRCRGLYLRGCGWYTVGY
jgi:hypothetical protein